MPRTRSTATPADRATRSCWARLRRLTSGVATWVSSRQTGTPPSTTSASTTSIRSSTTAATATAASEATAYPSIRRA